MALENIRTAMKTALLEVPGIGVVTDHEPLATRKEDFEGFFKHADLPYVQGWTITRESTGERASSTAATRRDHLMVVRGYRAIGATGATEKAFQDLVEAVCVRLRRELRDQYGGIAAASPPTVRVVEPRSFAGYLVHYVEIAQTCSEWPVVVAA
jgi:hypothetical protein